MEILSENTKTKKSMLLLQPWDSRKATCWNKCHGYSIASETKLTTFLDAPFTSHLTCDFQFYKFTATTWILPSIANHRKHTCHFHWRLVQQVSLLLRINPTPALEMRQCVKCANAPGTLCEMRWGPLGGDLLLATQGRDDMISEARRSSWGSGKWWDHGNFDITSDFSLG